MFPAWLYDRQQQQAGAAQNNPAEPPRILHMNVTVLRECSKYPTLEMDESCKLNKHWMVLKIVILIYCDVPGSPCLSKTGLMYGPFFLKKFVHL